MRFKLRIFKGLSQGQPRILDVLMRLEGFFLNNDYRSY